MACHPSTQMNLKLEAVDIGEIAGAARLSRRREARQRKAGGHAYLVGNPQSPDYASLTGSLTVEARTGNLQMDPGSASCWGS